jgi:hypothetical protein
MGHLICVLVCPHTVMLSAAKHPFHFVRGRLHRGLQGREGKANAGILRFAQNDNLATTRYDNLAITRCGR